MALNDYKITPTDEQGKLHTGQPQRLSDAFQTYQEVQAFMDSYGQLVKNKHNGFIDEISLSLERKADKIYKGDLPVSNILDIPFSIQTVRYLIGPAMPANAPTNGTTWSTIETKPCSSGRWLELHWLNWGGTPTGNMFSAILDTESKIFVSNWKEIAATDKIDSLFESGNWTPRAWGVSQIGLIINSAKYYKTNKQVTAQANITFPTLSTVENISFDGLPFIPLGVGFTFSCVVNSTSCTGCINPNGSFGLYNSAGALLDSSALSGKTVIITVTYLMA